MTTTRYAEILYLPEPVDPLQRDVADLVSEYGYEAVRRELAAWADE